MSKQYAVIGGAAEYGNRIKEGGSDASDSRTYCK